MSGDNFEPISNSVSEMPLEATFVIELTPLELAQVAGGIRAIGLITVDK